MKRTYVFPPNLNLQKVLSHEPLRDIVTNFLSYENCLTCRIVCKEMNAFFKQFAIHEIRSVKTRTTNFPGYESYILTDISRVKKCIIKNWDRVLQKNVYKFCITTLNYFSSLKMIDIQLTDKSLHVALLNILSGKHQSLEDLTVKAHPDYVTAKVEHLHNALINLENLKVLRVSDFDPAEFFPKLPKLPNLKIFEFGITWSMRFDDHSFVFDFKKFPKLEELTLNEKCEGYTFLGAENHSCLKTFDGDMKVIASYPNLCTNLKYLKGNCVLVEEMKHVELLPKFTNLSMLTVFINRDNGTMERLCDPNLRKVLKDFLIFKGGVLKEAEEYKFGLSAKLVETEDEKIWWFVTSDLLIPPKEHIIEAMIFLRILQDIMSFDILFCGRSKEMEKTLLRLGQHYRSLKYTYADNEWTSSF